ncbi:TPA: hypothetical protein DCW38_02945 [candidate division WOR-3 bacterium]|uniref:Uncharacterized protein n=1 Tax=candidate division WOR-3 bacterium TaxID=2052148 RepID=A0A350H9A3_UNCW3|nr:hypothetical protein [candidate division WOR-3 bacterium]
MIERYGGIKNLDIKDILLRNNLNTKIKNLSQNSLLCFSTLLLPFSLSSKEINFFNTSSLQLKIQENGINNSVNPEIVNIKAYINPSGGVHKTENGIPSGNSIVELNRKPIGSSNFSTEVVWDLAEQWASNHLNYTPDLQDTDTLFIYAKKDTLDKEYSAKTWMLGSDKFSLEICLDNPEKLVKAFTPNILAIKDISSGEENLETKIYLDKNQIQKIDGKLDTIGFYSSHQLYFNLEQQDSMFSHGDSFTIRLEKRLVNQPTSDKDIVYFTEIKSAIDTTFWDAMKVNANNSIHNGAFHGDTLYFPMFVETIDNGTALNSFSYTYNVIGDTIILNYADDNAQGYNISRKKSNQKNYEIIVKTEKSQYKDVVKENGVYHYKINALDRFGKTLNCAFFAVNKVRGLHQSKIINIISEEDKRLLKLIIDEKNVYNLSGRRIHSKNDIVIGKYFIKE